MLGIKLCGTLGMLLGCMLGIIVGFVVGINVGFIVGDKDVGPFEMLCFIQRRKCNSMRKNTKE